MTAKRVSLISNFLLFSHKKERSEQNETEAYATPTSKKEKHSNSPGNVLLEPRENVGRDAEKPRKSGRKMV